MTEPVNDPAPSDEDETGTVPESGDPELDEPDAGQFDESYETLAEPATTGDAIGAYVEPEGAQDPDAPEPSEADQ